MQKNGFKVLTWGFSYFFRKELQIIFFQERRENILEIVVWKTVHIEKMSEG